GVTSRGDAGGIFVATVSGGRASENPPVHSAPHATGRMRLALLGKCKALPARDYAHRPRLGAPPARPPAPAGGPNSHVLPARPTRIAPGPPVVDEGRTPRR